jgi:hypothetical protein
MDRLARVLAFVATGIFGACVGMWVGTAIHLNSREEPANGDAAKVVRSISVSSSSPVFPRGSVSTTEDYGIPVLPPLKKDQGISSVPLVSSDRPPQFVVLAFDGSRSLETWQQTRAFAREMVSQGRPLQFTYFISGVYFLSDPRRMLYTPPRQATGTSLIGFAASDRDVADRIEQVNQAIQEGHEIGSHLNGHFNGTGWTQAEWQKEFDLFRFFTEHAQEINQLDQMPLARRRMDLPQGMKGFRAPELAVSDGLWPVLVKEGYRYDTSLAARWDVWPTRNAHGLWEFPLAQIPYNTSTRPILSMDYNFYYKQSQANDRADRGTAEWQRFHQEMLTSYREYFNHNYQGNRTPVFIGHHFSDWNDGVYWEAMKDFARAVCGLPEVRCTTFSALADYLEAQERAANRL